MSLCYVCNVSLCLMNTLKDRDNVKPRSAALWGLKWQCGQRQNKAFRSAPLTPF